MAEAAGLAGRFGPRSRRLGRFAQVDPARADTAPMEPHTGPSDHHVKRVLLPSGKTIEVVYFAEDDSQAAPRGLPVAEPAADLHVCVRCASTLAYPIAWEEASADSWSVAIRCPECEEIREGVFAQTAVEAFDEKLDAGAEALETDYRRLLRANMAEETERFGAALRAGAILAEDF